MSHSRIIPLILLLFFLASCASIHTLSRQEKAVVAARTSTNQDPVVVEIFRIKKAIESRYGVHLIINRVCRTYWGRYRLTANNKELLRYFRMMEAEIKKYPSDYFIKSRANMLCFGEHLSVKRVVVAAVPVPEINTILYSLSRDIKGKGRKPYKIGYLTNTFHHELFHNTDYVIWGRHYYKWDKWQVLNVPGFRYAGKGTMAYTQKDKMKKMKLQKGFMNKYSQTGMEEDRAEIMEAIMLYPENKHLIRRCQRDEIIRKKVNLINEIVNKRILNDQLWSQLRAVVNECNKVKLISELQ